MSNENVTGYLVEIDGKPEDFIKDIEVAKQWALNYANGVSSIKITSVGPSGAPSFAYYWDYEINDWVFSENAAFADSKRKDEKNSILERSCLKAKKQ